MDFPKDPGPEEWKKMEKVTGARMKPSSGDYN